MKLISAFLFAFFVSGLLYAGDLPYENPSTGSVIFRFNVSSSPNTSNDIEVNSTTCSFYNNTIIVDGMWGKAMYCNGLTGGASVWVYTPFNSRPPITVMALIRVATQPYSDIGSAGSNALIIAGGAIKDGSHSIDFTWECGFENSGIASNRGKFYAGYTKASGAYFKQSATEFYCKGVSTGIVAESWAVVCARWNADYSMDIFINGAKDNGATNGGSVGAIVAWNVDSVEIGCYLKGAGGFRT